MRAARQLRATPTNAQPKLTAPLAAALPERRRPCAVPTNVATWRFFKQATFLPARGHASCRRVFWSERLRHASSKRKGAFAPTVIASLLAADMSFAHITLPRTNAPAATCSIGAPPRFLRAASPHARDATSDIAAAAKTPTALCRGAHRSWRPMAPGRRERVREAANPGPPAADSRGAPSALEVQRQCAAEALARAGLPPFPPLPPEGGVAAACPHLAGRAAFPASWRALRAIRNADAAENAHVTPARPWSLFLLTPRMLLARPGLDGAAGRRLLLERIDRYERGEWLALLAAAQRARSHSKPRGGRRRSSTPPAARGRVPARRQGEISRARHLPTSGTLAPGDEATWEALTDPAKRPAQAHTPAPDELLHSQPEEPARITAGAIARTLRGARRGAAPGLSGARAEHFKLLLGDVDGLELLMHAASVLAQARVPPAVAAALALARMAALQKPDGGVRGIATGDVFCRLVSRALAKKWAATFDEATRPYQHALSARTGMDALVARWRKSIGDGPGCDDCVL